MLAVKPIPVIAANQLATASKLCGSVQQQEMRVALVHDQFDFGALRAKSGRESLGLTDRNTPILSPVAQ